MTKLPNIPRQNWMSDSYWQELVLFHENYFGPAARDRYASALPNYSNVTAGILEAVKELLDNPPDAEATHITVVIYPRVLIVYDNGHGMVPFFTEEGLGLANERIVAIKRNSLGLNDDLRGIVTDVSQRSLLWPSTYAGMSSKAGRRQTTGYRGVGIQGSIQIGEPVEFISRPRSDLAEEFYQDPALQRDPPVYRWLMPTFEQVLKRQVDPDIRPFEGNFVDHNGKPIDHGTIVRVNNLKPEAVNVLQPDHLIKILQSRYGGRIRSGLVIEVIDRFTPAGVKTPEGKVYKVPPSVYRGYLLIDHSGEEDDAPVLVMRSGGQRIPVRAQIYWTPDPTDQDQLMMRRNGIDTVPISTVDALKHSPWTINGLTGYIEFPEENLDTTGLTKQEAISAQARARYLVGSTDKKWFANSPHLNAWVRLLKERLEERIEPAVREQRSEIQRQIGDQISKEMEEVIRSVLSEDDEIRQLMRLPQIASKEGRSHNGSSGVDRGPRAPIPPGELHIQVLNEHRTGISGVSVAIFQAKRQLTSIRSQGANDVVVQLPPGTYNLAVELPDEWELEEAYNPYPITLEKGTGKRMIFHVITHTPPPAKIPRITGVHIYGMRFGLERAGDIFDDEHFKSGGTVRYNQDHPIIKAAQGPGHEAQWRSLLAHIVADSIGRNFLNESYELHLARQKQALLFHKFIDQQPAKKRQQRVRKAS